MIAHSDRARPALVRLATEDPALAALSLWCSHRDAETGPAARTEGETIWYGPAFALLPPHEQMGLAAHHVLHVALRHGPRMGGMALRLGAAFDEALYGLAADGLVNSALLAAGYALPRPAVTLQDLLLKALLIPQGQDALADWDVDRLYLHLSGQGGTGKDQTAARAKALAAELSFTPDLAKAPSDEENPDAADQAALWRQHLSRAMEAGRLAGRGIGLLGHRIADIPQTRTPWEQVLRRLLSRALMPGRAQTHRRPANDWIAAEALSRSTQSPTPAFRPGTKRQTEAPRVVVALDASGSITDALLHRFLSEVAQIARRVAAEVTLLAFDEAVRWQVKLDLTRWPDQLKTLDFPRGGGTDFAPPVQAAQALGASALVVLTDLEGPFGPAPKGLTVIWATTGKATAPYGTTLDLSR